MKVEMVMPQMGESITEATVLKWLKAVGDQVKKDETILEISTDKVDSEIPAPADGKIAEILAQEGDTVEVKKVIAYIETESGAAESTPIINGTTKAASSVETDTAEERVPSDQPTAVQTVAPTAELNNGQTSSTLPTKVGQRFYSPLVRSMAAQHGLTPLDLAAIPGTGENGRVTKNDVLLYLEYRNQGGTTSAEPAKSAPQTPPPVPKTEYGEDGIKTVPMDRMRKLIADHMVRSKATSPHVYSVAEVDVTNISKCREKNKKAFLEREGFKLSYTPFFLEATVKALMQFPYINSSVEGDNIILKRDINLGCAVALGNTGLIVPVIKHADQLNFVGVARQLYDLAKRARNKKLKPDDTQGGTFTVTNPGIFGNIIGCPIINQPQVAILAICAIKKRPVVVDNDSIAIRDIVNLTLSYDHRIIDGSLSGQFLAYLTEYLENWDPNQTLV